MTSPEPIAAEELHSCYMDHVRASLIGGCADARDLLAQINRGELLVCWSDAWLAPPARHERRKSSGVAVAGARCSLLASALRQQADAYEMEDCRCSAADCYWLASKLSSGAVQVASRDRVANARQTAAEQRTASEKAEREASRRRARDLDRWQQAEARAGSS